MFANCLTRKKVLESNKFSLKYFFQIRSMTVKFLIIILHKCNSLLHFWVHSEKSFFQWKAKKILSIKSQRISFYYRLQKKKYLIITKFAFEKLNKMIGAVLKPFLNTELKILLNLKNISFFYLLIEIQSILSTFKFYLENKTFHHFVWNQNDYKFSTFSFFEYNLNINIKLI
jgi:hypothetical protein